MFDTLYYAAKARIVTKISKKLPPRPPTPYKGSTLPAFLRIILASTHFLYYDICEFRVLLQTLRTVQTLQTLPPPP
jgi:hypothetical protein